MKVSNWYLVVHHPLTGEILTTETHRSIRELAVAHPHIKEETWRNISIGRSKIYDKFIKLIKE